MAATALLLPVQPLMVSAFHTGMMEVTSSDYISWENVLKNKCDIYIILTATNPEHEP